MIYIYEGILSSGVSLVQLGEEQFGQEGINFGFTLDGTKDSCKFDVLSFRRESVKPFSVVCHHETSSWWIVQKDKVERYTNESGWIYKHSLQCIGAIELLNARDLTNCGFNQGKYTLREFILRLFKLSNFEFNTPTLPSNTNIDLDQVVNYIKTFENYTLLSALRELLDGYNQCAKLNFTRNLTYNQITGCELIITPKTGDISLQVLDIDTDFNNVQELRNMDKNSYGTIVVSNIDNAVSSETKIYPNVGGAKLSSTTFELKPSDATIKLPSNIFMVESVEVCLSFYCSIEFYDSSWGHSYTLANSKFNSSNDIGELLDRIKERILLNYNHNFDEEDYDSKYEEMSQKIYNGTTVLFKQGCVYNPQTKSWSYKDNSYSIKELAIRIKYNNLPENGYSQIVLCDEETANGSHNPWSCIKWKRGSDEISGFGWISYDYPSWAGTQPDDGGWCYVPATQTINGENECVFYEYPFNNNGFTKARLKVSYVAQNIQTGSGLISVNCLTVDNFYKQFSGTLFPAYFKVKYIPMTDLKVMLDNNEDNKHTHLYNQNGKLTDTLAFSKLINSYKTEIESENVVKYHTCYELFTLGTSTFKTIGCPKLGQIVLDSNNEQYVINSVSYNLYQNEPNEYTNNNTTYTQYYIECEYNLSKNVATKSLMVNPNTNIRDYGIPQKYNVRRTHLYRDFWEIDHSDSPHLDLPHQPLSKVLNISNTPKQYNQHTAIMRIAYSHEINNSVNWYYQLESTTYMLKKAIFECVEFKDNNIIGYDAQCVFSGFDITRVLTGMTHLINTPISYVDENGNFNDIHICMCNAEQMSAIYENYKTDKSITTDLPLQNMMIFIPQEIYEDYAVYNKDYSMSYIDYKKDALEVPVFEYACQLDDTSDVIIGENVLINLESDKCYLYSYKLVAKGVINNNNWSALEEELISIDIDGTSGESALFMNNACKMELYTNKIRISLHTQVEFEKPSQNITYSSKVSMSSISDYDIVIVRHCVSDYSDTYQDTQQVDYQRNKKDLMFVIRHTENASVEDDIMSLSLNVWRLD